MLPGPRTSVRPLRRTRHRLQLLALRGVARGARLVPFRARSWIFGCIARIAGATVLQGRARRNLRIAFGETLGRDARRDLRRRNARLFGRMVAELVDYFHEGGAAAERLVFTDDSVQNLKDGLARGRGVIVLTPHFGNWELFPAALAARGFHGAVVGRRPSNPGLAGELVAMRARAGVETLDSRSSTRAILRVLQKGGIVGILPDLDTKRIAGEFVPFFGKPAFTATGPALLALLSGAPLLTAFMIAEGDRYRLVFDPPFVGDPDAPRGEEVRRLTGEWAQRFESRIREFPDHWVWVHDRWATTPEKVEERSRRKRVTAP